MGPVATSRAHRRSGLALRLLLVLATLLPMVLGPAMLPLTRALGGLDAHRCACGMVRGQCGCPECEAQDGAGLGEQGERAYPVLRSGCGGEEIAQGGASLPPSVLSAGPIFVPKSPWILSDRPQETPLDLEERPAPSTPPPRSALLAA